MMILVDPEATEESLMDQYINPYLLRLVHQRNQSHDPVLLREAMNQLEFPSYTTYPNARITTYCAEIFERLDAIGYGEFKTKNPKHTIKLIIEMIRTQALRAFIGDRVNAELGLEKNVRKFVQTLKEDVRALQAFGQQLGTNRRLLGPSSSRYEHSSSEKSEFILRPLVGVIIGTKYWTTKRPRRSILYVYTLVTEKKKYVTILPIKKNFKSTIRESTLLYSTKNEAKKLERSLKPSV